MTATFSYSLVMMPNPRWLPPARYWQAGLRSPDKDWLLSRGSLTAYLIALSHGDFKVRVVHQGWHRPHLDERLALALPAAQRAWVREVALVCRGEIWVQARSIIPIKTLRGRGRRLRYLGSRSLGSLLFKGGRREEMLVRHSTQPLTRRSRFSYAGQPLLVQESFLPRLFSAASQQPIKL